MIILVIRMDSTLECTLKQAAIITLISGNMFYLALNQSYLSPRTAMYSLQGLEGYCAVAN